ncbi:uncharacterized protein LOC120169336 [Hibiscus syriacus]|uniref:uncharacterized protein LOC120169336 n=1 Tax=Hibiscus syriacus TaxID=106335 RepID=UPI0019207A3B|nr:uncharacterized protein LOC120169336 [Hibiscus syriacus]
MVTNEDNELLPMRTITGWKISMDYRKLNNATKKYHFSLLFINKILDQLEGKAIYCFSDGMMPFRLCNVPNNFSALHPNHLFDMVEDFLEIFMDDFSVSGYNLELCLGFPNEILPAFVDTEATPEPDDVDLADAEPVPDPQPSPHLMVFLISRLIQPLV